MKWLADENLHNAIIRGLLRQDLAIDIVRAQDIPEISGKDDRELLRFATSAGRVVLTHDISTMIPAMHEQIRIASRCTPIVLVADSMSIGAAIEDLLILNDCAVETDWTAGVIYIPLR